MEKEYSADRGCEGRGICGSPIKGRFLGFGLLWFKRATIAKKGLGFRCFQFE